VNIVSVVVLDGQHAIITFDGDPGYNGASADASFLIGGGGAQLTTDEGTNAVGVEYFGANWAAGDQWDLVAQPQWANNPVVNPASGGTAV
jgi:hypothetical protein